LILAFRNQRRIKEEVFSVAEQKKSFAEFSFLPELKADDTIIESTKANLGALYGKSKHQLLG